MPAWAVGIISVVVGSFAGAAGTLVFTRRSVRRGLRRDARSELLSQIIPALTAEKHPILSSGTYRGALVEFLDRLRGAAFVCSHGEQVAAASLAQAWRSAIPLDMMTAVQVTQEQSQEIDVRREALRLLVEKRLRPFGARFYRSVEWP